MAFEESIDITSIILRNDHRHDRACNSLRAKHSSCMATIGDFEY